MTSLAERQKELAGYLLSGFSEYGLKPWSLKGACASVGNATQENSCLPVTEGAKDHGSDGIYQWRLYRLAELKSWAASKGLDWTTIKTQAAFHMLEMQRDYATLNQWLIDGAKPLETLTADICDIYERPSVAGRVLDYRIKFAREAMALIPQPATSHVATATGTAGAAILTLAGVINWLQHSEGGPVLALIVSAIIMFVSSLVIGRRPPQAPTIILPPQPPSTSSAVEQLRDLLAQRAALDARILDLEPHVKAAISDMNDVLGQIHPVIIASSNQQELKL